MKLSVKVTQIANQQKTCLVVGVYEGGEFTESSKKIDQMSRGALKATIQQSGFKAAVGQTLPLFRLPNTALQTLLLVGCGKRDGLTLPTFRRIICAAAKSLTTMALKEATIYLTDLPIQAQKDAWKVKQIVEAIKDSAYVFDQFKTQKAPPIILKQIIIHLTNRTQQKTCEQALQQGLAIAEGVTYTKTLANLPSNICTPTFLANEAKKLARSHRSLKTQVFTKVQMKKMGMGALLAVAQGSAEPPQFIAMQYRGAHTKQAPIALVGKGVTFDTGGNSLKTPDSMVGMKYDMCGAATVLGVLKAAALLKLPINLVGVIPTVENMPGGTAYKPEDIVTSLSGQTIEVISTDAEGRLILADALTYCKRFKPSVVIDIATLTGAIVIALGSHAIGLFSNHDELAKSLLKAGEDSNDRAWQLPLWEDYQEQINSPFADISNVGGRSAGSITAACFLSRFTKTFRWAHLDVAGTAAFMMNDVRRMATGRPVPLLMQYLLNLREER